MVKEFYDDLLFVGDDGAPGFELEKFLEYRSRRDGEGREGTTVASLSYGPNAAVPPLLRSTKGASHSTPVVCCTDDEDGGDRSGGDAQSVAEQSVAESLDALTQAAEANAWKATMTRASKTIKKHATALEEVMRKADSGE